MNDEINVDIFICQQSHKRLFYGDKKLSSDTTNKNSPLLFSMCSHIQQVSYYAE